MSLKIKDTTPDHALRDYLDRIYIQSHSQASVNSYRTAIIGIKNGFRIFLKEKYNCDEIQLTTRIQNQELDVYNVLNEYVIFLDKKGIKPKSIRLWFTVVKGYFTHLQVEVFSEKCKQRVKLPKVRRVKKEALTKEILVKLFRNLDAKLETAILVAISSGMRVGEIAGLTLADVEFNQEPVKINVRAETSKSREDRETFLTNEASEALKDYLKRYFGWKEDNTNSQLDGLRIFGRTSKIRTSSLKGLLPKLEEQLSDAILLQKTLERRIAKVPELNRLARNGRKVIHFHAFREYFYTVVSNVSGSNFAHALMGHHEYLDTYYTLSNKQQIQLYQKAIPYLTITDYSKIERDLEKIQNNQSDMLEKYAEVERYLRAKDPSFLEFLKRNEER
ncbi:MAG TPA: tyrosine-type recombinase/integrase [Nitrosopumilaceae archaeon]|nr:tyrosine-type recombinase/integrase [Nitrosopumilaceae archaeon]